MSHGWEKPLCCQWSVKRMFPCTHSTQLCSLPAATWPSCLTTLLFGPGCMWEHEGKWHWGRDLRHGALAIRGLLVGLRHSALCFPSSALDSLSVWLPRTHLGKAEKSLILYLVQGPLPLMTVDDNPAGNKGISPVTWNGKQWGKVKKTKIGCIAEAQKKTKDFCTLIWIIDTHLSQSQIKTFALYYSSLWHFTLRRTTFFKMYFFLTLVHW